jgi:hypothetical protein
MPVIAVNLSQKTYADIMTLVDHGVYSGPEQFLEISAFNQLALERGLTPEALLKGIHRPASVESFSKQAAEATEEEPSRHQKDSVPGIIKPGIGRGIKTNKTLAAEVSDDEINDALSRFSREECLKLNLQPSPEEAHLDDERIWGQVNRLFALKAACRWIATDAASAGQWPGLHVALDRIAIDASILGSALERADVKHHRKREELVAVGLPRKGNLQSRDRFATQFIARVNRTNRIYPGAIAQYKLASFEGDRLELTKTGIELAGMKNPILDFEFGTSTKTLSDDERAFLLRLVWDHVPAEKQDFSLVLKAVKKGNSTPPTLMEAVRSDFPAIWSDVMFRTHVYGVLARLSELGILIKKWEGRHVEYEVDEPALGPFEV